MCHIGISHAQPWFHPLPICSKVSPTLLQSCSRDCWDDEHSRRPNVVYDSSSLDNVLSPVLEQWIKSTIAIKSFLFGLLKKSDVNSMVSHLHSTYVSMRMWCWVHVRRPWPNPVLLLFTWDGDKRASGSTSLQVNGQTLIHWNNFTSRAGLQEVFGKFNKLHLAWSLYSHYK